MNIRAKNIYTILEKVKKGEFKSYYKEKDSLFSKIDFYRKPDLVKPHLHYLDESRLTSIMDHHFSDNTSTTKAYNNYYNAVPSDKRVPYDQYRKQVIDCYYNKFPKHLVRDIFKMYYNKIDKLEFTERTDANYTQFKMLEKSNHPISKILSESSQLKSAVYTRAMVEYFVNKLVQLEIEDPQKGSDLTKSLEKSSEFDNKDTEKILQDLLESSASKKDLEQVMDNATDICKSLDKVMDNEQQEQMFQAANGSEAAKLDVNYLNTIKESLERVNMSTGSLKNKIKNLLNKSVSYFTSKTKVQFEDIFNSDNVSEIEDEYLLHPKLRKLFAEDIMVKDTTSVGKIDVYIDVSGSMDSPCGVKNIKNQEISKMEFAKSLIFKMKEMDILNDLYIFNNSVKLHKTDPISIAMMSASGGTNINNVVRRININGVNALVVTDAEDHCNEYSDLAYFIGVKGACFNHFHESVRKDYYDKDQFIIFDGDKISKVDSEGYVIS